MFVFLNLKICKWCATSSDKFRLQTKFLFLLSIRRNKKRNDWYKRKHVNPIEGPDAALQADGGKLKIILEAYSMV